MLLEFVAKGELLQVSNRILLYPICFICRYMEYYYIVWFLLHYNCEDLICHQNHIVKLVECYCGSSCYVIQH